MRIIKTLLLAAAAMCTAGQAYAIDIDREYQETFDVEPGMRLHLEHGDGDVSINPWERDAVEIHVRYIGSIKKVGLGKVDTDFRAEFDVEGRTVYAKGFEPGGAVLFGFLSESSVDYQWTIKAPAYLLLELQGDDGDVFIIDWEAEIRGYNQDGDYVLEDFRGDLRLNLDDGDLSVDGFEGRLDLDIEDGDVVLRNIDSIHTRITSDDGDVLIDNARGHFELEGQDGDIDLDQIVIESLSVELDDGRVVASEISGEAPDIDVRTADGDVRLSFTPGTSYSFLIRHNDSSVLIDAGKIADLEESDRRVSGTVGDGRGHVRVHTDDGRVAIYGGN